MGLIVALKGMLLYRAPTTLFRSAVV